MILIINRSDEMSFKIHRKDDKMKPEQKIRAILSFILFDAKSHQKRPEELITFAALVKQVFQEWTYREKDWILTHTYKEIQDRKPDRQDLVFWQVDRMKFAAALFLYAVVPYYKFCKWTKGVMDDVQYDKHAQLILELLMIAIDGGTVDAKLVQDFTQEYYWNTITARYMRKVQQLLNMSDNEFMNLGNCDTWLND
jgi:hypothetical protein